MSYSGRAFIRFKGEYLPDKPRRMHAARRPTADEFAAACQSARDGSQGRRARESHWALTAAMGFDKPIPDHLIREEPKQWTNRRNNVERRRREERPRASVG